MSEQNTQSFRVFLSHASEDMDKASRLGQKLSEEGMEVWWDKERLLPGQDWKLEIAKTIDNSHAILVCLSERSVRKEGYAQKEIRDALEKAEEKPEGTIFLIPVRWDDCEVPRKLADIQYVDLFTANGYEKLLKALEVRAKSLGLSFPGRKAFQTPKPDNTYELHSIIKNMLRDKDGLQESLLHLKEREPDDQGWFHHQIRTELQMRMGDPNRPVKERARAGDILSILGDPRFRTDAWYLPDDELLGFVKIPAGSFLMGNPDPVTRQQEERETPCHRIDLQEFYISRYPVTFAQYYAFLKHTNEVIEENLIDESKANHPVTSVTWHGAVQYCHWIMAMLRQWSETPETIARLLKTNEGGLWGISLPSEVEWEKAARGTGDSRQYPWGARVDPSPANHDATGLKKSSTVGCFKEGASPYGLQDMSGNVWEWTRNNWGLNVGHPSFNYPYSFQDGREDFQTPDNMLKVIRGGSFYSPTEEIRCSHRGAALPINRYNHVGFRIVITPFMRQ